MLSINLLNLININQELPDSLRFSIEHWKYFVDLSFRYDLNFNKHVEDFYTLYLQFDNEDCEDLVTDIQLGDGDAFERFINDIFYYCLNE